MSGEDLSREPREPRAAVRVVRPGGNAGRHGSVPQAPPMPMAPPTSLPPWLDRATREPEAEGGAGTGSGSGTRSDAASGSGSGHGSGSGAGGWPGSGGAGFGAGSGGGSGAESGAALGPEAELTPEQRELRDLLHRAVGELTPMPGALEQLRRAVPRRRRQRRRIVGTVAATVALCSLGTLALHSAGVSISTTDGPQSSQHYGDTANNTTHGPHATGSPTLVPVGPGRMLPGVGSSFAGGTSAAGHNSASVLPGASGVLQPAPSLTRPAVPGSGSSAASGGSAGSVGGSSAPVAECTRAQLGNGADTVGSPDAAGVVYGTFQVSNVSSTACKVSTPGDVSVLAVSGTDRSWISVAPHTAGDPAGGLPQPEATPSPVQLAPGASYLVEFAWVPATGTGAPSCTDSSAPGSTDSPAPGTDGSTQTSGGDTTAPTQGSATPTITLAHTPGAGGAAAASAVITNACAGTVYRTAQLSAG
ncbi:hypothetical protein ACEZDB_10035 [Streptacidiphilus sp. N1-3]|uniref:DUF4232 domain-containing protein n=1 Tax=Streptacidiphilus alkalitolerans TaxID=3342712 RepID=A0ABV6WY77_9ACTN